MGFYFQYELKNVANNGKVFLGFFFFCFIILLGFDTLFPFYAAYSIGMCLIIFGIVSVYSFLFRFEDEKNVLRNNLDLTKIKAGKRKLVGYIIILIISFFFFAFFTIFFLTLIKSFPNSSLAIVDLSHRDESWGPYEGENVRGLFLLGGLFLYSSLVFIVCNLTAKYSKNMKFYFLIILFFFVYALLFGAIAIPYEFKEREEDLIYVYGVKQDAFSPHWFNYLCPMYGIDTLFNPCIEFFGNPEESKVQHAQEIHFFTAQEVRMQMYFSCTYFVLYFV